MAALAGPLFSQAAVSLSKDAPFFKEPGGVRLGTLLSGARVGAGPSAGGFTQVTLTGWIFTASTRPDAREGFDLSVSVGEGENIRATPGGAILARAVLGALFKRLDTQGGWTRVQRTGWISDPAARRQVGSASGDSGSGRPDSSRSAEPPSRRAAESRAIIRSGIAIRSNPDGRDQARMVAPAEVSLGETSGEWVRVRLDGWVRRGDVDSATIFRPAITGAMLRENPDRYVGQTVDWRVQFLALQQADELRPEMSLGQPYLLVRGPLPESGFAYVMLTRAQADLLQGLSPLEELGLTVTVRAGRTRYLATPVVELVRRMP